MILKKKTPNRNYYFRKFEDEEFEKSRTMSANVIAFKTPSNFKFIILRWRFHEVANDKKSIYFLPIIIIIIIIFAA